ncbi:non-canonical purine NTP pyrophosphatase, RdgB/HAM1 family [Candidatus Kaiserbacteria bacterium RIFCSPHIGHO2_02_FULL_59_21]|uniref:dITP/XTP pyrophosphatase n=2 Tax=Candidatus Kaiseribacteriota TaxID=1752734 RepID=A0A0G1YWI5_9BACT|nr:MAG: Non-canonical purine NTP pyrophosphatase [Candidatus Kaiserbacteria bacterium GW2011_GWA2_58_9]OGG62150.1 MAG: non-canonical purine NTP pyrophosphatase, RdgB/HAM1 family [Candidatus Kaiserbacteria bacterium RIFCSPHIGHO2_01_FULL_58_22]OGG67394.1 MAG: non-canonical purine NTP pyrophosphatase, RdgB/HAM1 family [Candidatus Kaiserbacteria bacterium RIFCSPHIGHO2_02_FULL_59_21]OGG78908.1 MAG: non-canonical purine NTP pyrophosphatase, RdgB/HAM1 family [Candidatus Kaiserbacteria bacterium RIFCSPL
MRELLIATRNRGKLREMLDALGEIPFAILTLADVAAGADVEETGTTFEENAVLKARTYGTRTGKLTLAEDSGLQVEALGGKPGVLSARYAEGNDEARYRKLLREMEDVPDKKRTARFVAAVAMYDPATDGIRTCEGSYGGRITREPRGSGGFGYDPVFFSDELQKTGAEISVEEKNSVSHRGRALAKARTILLSEFSGFQ